MSTLDIKSALKHALFLLAELPVSIIYFTVAVTGLSLSAGLLPLFLLGIPLFIGVMGFAAIIAKFEYARYHALLKEMPEPYSEKTFAHNPQGILNRAKYALTNPDGWKGILLMLIKLPFGIAAFTIITVLLSISLGFLAYPIVYYILMQAASIDIYEGNVLAMFTNLGPTEASIVYFVVGLLISYGVIKVIPAISKIYLQASIRILKL